jgi:D-glycerate 3-kinase
MVTPDPRLVDILGGWIRSCRRNDPPLIGVTGPQAIGKTTLCRAAAEKFGAAHFSIDDVYMTKAEREKIARDVHPLFITRGPPGTHDLDLARTVIEKLSHAGTDSRTSIPFFDKLIDDRVPEDQWPVFEGRPSAILVAGWCLGAVPLDDVDLMRPVNKLEADEDAGAVWRQYWNAELRNRYGSWFGTFDAVLFLAPPSFEVVLDWRCEQEANLMNIAVENFSLENRARLARFIAHFEHLTTHMLKGGVRANATAHLTAARTVQFIS